MQVYIHSKKSSTLIKVLLFRTIKAYAHQISVGLPS